MTAEPWSEYPTIAVHPTHAGVRLVRHPNGPAIVNGPNLCTVGHIVRTAAEAEGPIVAGDLAEWIAKELAGAAEHIGARK